MSETKKESPWIVNANDETFQQLAAERSREMLVVVDFWAEWCQPCRLLAPTLDKLAAEYDGQFLLVKANTDEAPGIAGGFGVQSIPAVYALRDGAILDYFVGMLPEGQIRGWIDRLLPSAAERLVVEARTLLADDPKAAEAKLREAVALDANLATAHIALGELLLAAGRTEEARAVVDELEKRGYLEPEAEKLKAQLHLSGTGASASELDALRTAVQADPRDLSSKLKLAEALAAAKQYSDALETALSLVQSGKKEFVEPARVLMVDIFRLAEDQSELVTDYRRRLSTALY